MNARQKLGIFVAASVLGVVILLHSPWTGYFIGPTDEHPDWMQLPFEMWMTESPVLPWFGNVQNFLVTVGLLLGLTALWCYLFRDQAEVSVVNDKKADTSQN